jgi:prepilin-type N-terminal cleavage/methylation domain-containing protein
VRDRIQTGMTLIEVVVVVALVSLALSIVALVSLPTLSREPMRGASYDVYTHLQLARTEAVSRNVPCRFVIDTGLGQMVVVDTRGTASILDDETLHTASFRDTVSFARPDGGSAITLASLSATTYFATFAADGTVTAGAGQIHLLGGNEYRRIELLGAGGVDILRWNGSAWNPGG